MADSRYLVISLSGDVLPTATHGQITSLRGWRCRYDLKSGTFDIPNDFLDGNAKAMPTSQSTPPISPILTDTPPPEPSQTYTVTDDMGRGYTVSAHDYQVLEKMKADLAPIIDSINKLQAKQQQDSAELQQEKTSLDTSDQATVDRYNGKVDTYNARRQSWAQKLTTTTLG